MSESERDARYLEALADDFEREWLADARITSDRGDARIGNLRSIARRIRQRAARHPREEERT